MAEENFDGKPLKDNLKDVDKAFSKIRILGSESEDIFKSIGSAITGMARDSKEFGEQIGSAGKIQKDLSKDAAYLATVNRKTLTDKKEIAKFEAASSRLQKNRLALDSKIKVLTTLRANASKAEQKLLDKTIENLRNGGDYAGEIASNFKEIQDANQKLNQDTSWLEGMADLADDIPVVGKLFGDFKKGAEEARKAGAEGGSALAAGGRAMGGAIGKLGLAFAGGTFLKAIFKTDQDVVNLQRNLNLSTDAATSLDKKFRQVGIAVKGLTGDDLRASTMAVSDQLGITADLSTKSGIAIATMTTKLGLSAEEAAKLATVTAATGQDLTEFNNDLVGRVMIQNSVNKTSIRYQDIMKDVANASSAVQISTANMPGGLAAAAFQARKLGLSFSSMEGIASNLLNFEDSIGAEMEAELLTGRNLELDGARRAALNNDMVGMAQELAKNGIDAAEFGNMNRIQQTAVAKAMGMSREEMSDMLIKQKAIAELSSVEGDTLDEKVRNEYKRISALEEGEEKEKAMAKLREQAGKSEMVRQLETQSATEAQADAMKNMTAALGDFSTLLRPVVGFFQNISTIAGETFGFITKMGSKLKAVAAFGADFAKQFRLAGRFLKNSKTTVQGIFKALGSGMKFAAKGGIKSLLKKIPILGALVGLGLAYKRFKSGDYLGAGMEFISGVASIFPGIGTAASVAIDASLMAMDYKGTTGSKSESATARRADPTSQAYSGMKVEDFTIRPLGEDTITMAGGTKLGGNVEKLLEQLISIVSNGGDVYLDGAKVGETLVLNSKLSN